MKSLPTVAIGIATYGRRSIVENTIDDLLRQETKPDSIIVVEQDAPYDVSALVDRCEQAGVRCKYVFSRYRSTPCARNYAILLCESEVIVFIDDDVEILTDIVKAHAEIHVKEPSVVAAGGLLTCYPKSVEHVQMNSFYPTTRYLNHVKGGNMSFKVAKVRQTRGFNDFIFLMTEENDYIRRLRRFHKALIANCPDAIVLHLAYGSGGTRKLGGTAKSGNDARSRAWWAAYVQDHVVSYGCNYGMIVCLVWFMCRFKAWKQAVAMAPSLIEGLRDLFANCYTGLRLQRHARRISDHVAFSEVLATNDVGISCPTEYLAKWWLVSPIFPDQTACSVAASQKAPHPLR